jgi:hypothetical protein
MSEHLLSNKLAIVSVIDPDNYTTGTYTGDAIDMQMHRRIMTIVAVGDFTADGTAGKVDCVLTESATSGGSYTQISGKSITQLTRAGSDSNKQAIINLSADELGTGMRYVKVSLRVTIKGADGATITLADNSRFTHAVNTTTFGDLSSVDEIVA